MAGINVYLMNRSPRSGGYRSPWAVKKVAQRFSGKRSDISQRLLSEAQILKDLYHPNIVGYRAFTKSVDGSLCLAMERAEHSLMDLIEDRLDRKLGPFEPSKIERVGVDVASALEYLHIEKLLMHGDVKSGNVLVFGQFEKAKLCDFGVSLALDAAAGRAKEGAGYVGTEAWSAPEVLAVDSATAVGSQADMFSYGLTIWEMLSLCLPHADKLDASDGDSDVDEDSLEEAYQEALGSRPPLPELAVAVGTDYSKAVVVFIACTEADPLDRPTATQTLEMWN